MDSEYPPLDDDEDTEALDLTFAESVLVDMAEDLRKIRRNTSFLAGVVLVYLLGIVLVFLLTIVGGSVSGP